MSALLVPTLLAAFVLFNVINLAAFHTWLERKQSAVMQDRIGANRASIFGLRLLGLFHPLADTIKMFLKEDYVPPGGNKFLHTLAPCLSIFFILIAFAAIPFGNTLTIGGTLIHLQVANLNVALVYIFAMMSMGVYGVVLAGFSSNNNYALFGGLRASSQMISYEISLGLTLMGLVIIFGTLDLQEMVHMQGKYFFGWIPAWGVFYQPLGLLLFLAAGLAETKRTPYDVPEGESEIVGYFVEYSGMKFGMFFFADYLETILIACLTATLFFGGWQVPWLYDNGFIFPWGGAIGLSALWVSVLQVISFSVKVFFFCWLFMSIRWTLPRFRYDQLIDFGWKFVFPIALANLFVTAILVLFLGAGS
ncbi:MAG: NADH-quinone oxidoreductase subunit H [Candidatus Omnitrophica bacterium CG12_big_fil_rev_8_21_14_0_65_45_16]|nr:MAG: NADH-quinone oxidoreductase subunit H [Candidatus Omnitrophica bacterium CG12_big_fil_rev_8_21_14_0_65_45_16]